MTTATEHAEQVRIASSKLAEARGLEDGAYDEHYRAGSEHGEHSTEAQDALKRLEDRKSETASAERAFAVAYAAQRQHDQETGPQAVDELGDWMMDDGRFANNQLILLARCDRSMLEIALEFESAAQPRKPLPVMDEDGILRPDLDGLVYEQNGRPIVQWASPDYRREGMGHDQGPVYLIDSPSQAIARKWEDAIAAIA